jgi:hypothetical protein
VAECNFERLEEQVEVEGEVVDEGKYEEEEVE